MTTHENGPRVRAWRRLVPPVLALASIAGGGGDATATEPRYGMIDLGEIGFLFNPRTHGSFGINNAGQVAFAVKNGSANVRAAMWLPAPTATASAGTHELSTDNLSILRDCNDSGLFVGQKDGLIDGEGDAIVVDTSVAPFVTDVLDVTCSDGTWGSAIAVNESDVILGRWSYEQYCDPCDDNSPDTNYVRSFHVVPESGAPSTWTYNVLPGVKSTFGDRCDDPIIEDPATVAHDLSDLSGDLFDVAGGSGTEVDNTAFPCQVSVTFVTIPAAWAADIDSAPTPDPDQLDQEGTLANESRGVNNNEEFVGWANITSTFGFFPTALYWSSATSSVFDLGSILPSGHGSLDNSWAEAINNNAFPMVVGYNFSSALAILWENQSGNPAWTATDLNDEIAECWHDDVVLMQAHDINDSGWIIAYGDGDSADGIQPHAFVLIPLGSCFESDIDGDGRVGMSDMLDLLVAWGNTSGPEDINGDGIVNILDHNRILVDWGLCPTGCENPLGLETKDQMEACMGIDWDTLASCLSDAPSANDDNCICWFEHYHDVHCDGVCLCSPNCPGSDPWSGH